MRVATGECAPSDGAFDPTGRRLLRGCRDAARGRSGSQDRLAHAGHEALSNKRRGIGRHDRQDVPCGEQDDGLALRQLSVFVSAI
jgi:hypothetical protein